MPVKKSSSKRQNVRVKDLSASKAGAKSGKRDPKGGSFTITPAWPSKYSGGSK